MKKIVCLLICFSLMFTSFFALAANAEKIEQVYSKLPEIKAYVKLDASYDKADITGYKNSDVLVTQSVEPFATDKGVSYIIMVDCSTSVSNSQLADIKKCVTSFISNSNENDRFVIASFGRTIDILSNDTASKEDAISALSGMDNNQTATVLFDAVSAVDEICEKLDSSSPSKRVCIIFTDAVDYTVGGTTIDELINTAEKSAAPIYTVAIDSGNKQSIDVLGRVSRMSGGEVFVANSGIANAFAKVSDEIGSLYEISFLSKTNIVDHEASNLRIQLRNGANESFVEKKFMTLSWNTDNVAPVILSAQQTGEKSVEIVFSEAVENAGNAENYTVKNGISVFPVASVLYNSETNSATINFVDEPGQGSYTISTANITDSSMEKNAVAGEFTFELAGFNAAMINVKNFFIHFWWAIVALVLIAVILVMFIIIKKRKGIVMVDNKATFADNIQYEEVKAEPLPTHYLQLIMEYADGRMTNLDINITQSIIFGRASSCEVTIDDDSLSRQHFAIELADGGLVIQNLSQTNGTLLNGVLMQSPRRLELGDVIVAGQEKFTVSKI